MRTLLAASAQSAALSIGIEQCGDCGLIHLHIGAVTLRLTPAAIAELHATLDRACVSLHGSSLHAAAPGASSH